MKQTSKHPFPPESRTGIGILTVAVAILIIFPLKAGANSTDTAALERHISELNQQLDQAKAELAAAKAVNTELVKNGTMAETEKVATIEQQQAATEASTTSKIKFGPVTIGGAMRVNYVYGDYSSTGCRWQCRQRAGQRLRGAQSVQSPGHLPL